MAKPRLTPRAKQELEEIWLTIAADNLSAADAFLRRVSHKLLLAAGQPGMGSPRPELGDSARVLIDGRYIIVYEKSDVGIDVIAIVHGMREPGTWL